MVTVFYSATQIVVFTVGILKLFVAWVVAFITRFEDRWVNSTWI